MLTQRPCIVGYLVTLSAMSRTASADPSTFCRTSSLGWVTSVRTVVASAPGRLSAAPAGVTRDVTTGAFRMMGGADGRPVGGGDQLDDLRGQAYLGEAARYGRMDGQGAVQTVGAAAQDGDIAGADTQGGRVGGHIGT